MSPIQLKRRRPPSTTDAYEPCEYEDGSRVKWVWVEGSFPPAQEPAPCWTCRFSAGGFVFNCPYPARMCRPKLELEVDP